ncbi:MAG TPA: hypothetical protein VNH11_16615 [Pirellulales bacterium]|nr:hypothetical protein [Pirellulales bacterium]
MRILSFLTAPAAVAAGVMLVAATTASAQDVTNSRAMPGNEAPAGPHVFYWGPPSAATPPGRPENQWRYRLHNGRWWYWTKDDAWSYYTGDTWVPYMPNSKFAPRGGPVLGPIAGLLGRQGVVVRGETAGLTAIPGDHAAAPNLRRGTVLPKYLKQQTLPGGENGPAPESEEPVPSKELDGANE